MLDQLIGWSLTRISDQGHMAVKKYQIGFDPQPCQFSKLAHSKSVDTQWKSFLERRDAKPFKLP